MLLIRTKQKKVAWDKFDETDSVCFYRDVNLKSFFKKQDLFGCLFHSLFHDCVLMLCFFYVSTHFDLSFRLNSTLCCDSVRFHISTQLDFQFDHRSCAMDSGPNITSGSTTSKSRLGI